jgi:hypothetical protein
MLELDVVLLYITYDGIELNVTIIPRNDHHIILLNIFGVLKRGRRDERAIELYVFVFV